MKKLNRFKQPLLIALLATILAAPISSVVNAAPQAGYTHYVTDELEVPFRRGPGYNYKIIRMLKSGSSVKILEVNEKKWARVSYRYKGEDIEGWMPSSLLQNQPIAKVKLANQIKKTARVKKKLNQVVSEKDTLNKRFIEASTELKSVKAENFKLQKELEEIKRISRKSIQLNEENEVIKQEIEKLKSENAIMREQIDQSEEANNRQWFLNGAGVLLVGLILGRLFRMPGKRKKWDTL